MSLQRLLNQPLSLQRVAATTTDPYGNVVTGGLGAPTTVYGYLEQVTTTETLVDRDTTVTDWKAYLPADTQIGVLDRITFNGATFEVMGLPAPWWNPRTQTTSHVTVKLKSVVG